MLGHAAGPRPAMQEKYGHAIERSAFLDMQDMSVADRHLPDAARLAGGEEQIA
jgi:hypothetical protein